MALNASGLGSNVRLGLRGTMTAGFTWNLFEVYGFVAGNWQSELWVTTPLGATSLLTTLIHGPAPPPANTFFTPVAWSSALGPSRLGARFHIPAFAGPADTPSGIADENFLTLSWFESETSQFNETVGGVNETVYSLADLGAPGTDCSRRILGPAATFTCTAGPSSPGVGVPLAKFTGVLIDGVLLDTDGIDQAPLLDPEYLAVAAGAFNIMSPPIDFLTAAPGATITFANTLLDYAGGAAAADITDNWLTQEDLFRGVPKTPQQPFVTNGSYAGAFTTNYPRSTKNPPGFSELAVDPAWLAANGHDPQDLTVVLDQHSPISGATTYAPVTITQKGAIEIDTPVGGRPSSWSINSGANGSVTENVGDTVFVVSNIAARFVRPYATNWRRYTTDSHFNPEWVIDGYSFLRRHYGIDFRGVAQATFPEDVWWWNSYMFLRLNITATAPAVVTLLVSGIDLQVYDSHRSGSGREADLMFAEFNDSRTYVFSVTGGPTDYWIDLSFPDAYVAASGAPFPLRRPRVESLQFAFSAVGTFTLNAMELSRRDPAGYATEVKISYSPQSTYNGEWPAVYLRTDGEATTILTYPDTLQKGMELDGGAGGSVRFAEPVQAPGSGSILSARQMLEQVQRIEGFGVVYTDALRAAFQTDAYGVDLVSQAGEPSQFVREVAPGAVFVGAGDAHAYSPAFAIRCGSIGFPNGLSVTVRGRHIFGGGVEAVAMSGGVRAGAGLNFDVLDQANVTLGSVVSDTRGRIHFEPVGFGEVVRFVAP